MTRRIPERGEYRTFYVGKLDEPEIQDLSPQAQHVWFLTTCALERFGIGVLYPTSLLPWCTALTPARVEAAWRELVDARILRRERNVLWLVDALGEHPNLSVDDWRHRRGAQRHLRGLPRLAIVAAFREHYARWFADEPPAAGAEPAAEPARPPATPTGGRGKALPRPVGARSKSATETGTGTGAGTAKAAPPARARAIPGVDLADLGQYVKTGQPAVYDWCRAKDAAAADRTATADRRAQLLGDVVQRIARDLDPESVRPFVAELGMVLAGGRGAATPAGAERGLTEWLADRGPLKLRSFSDYALYGAVQHGGRRSRGGLAVVRGTGTDGRPGRRVFTSEE
jgi:hypothetical protein